MSEKNRTTSMRLRQVTQKETQEVVRNRPGVSSKPVSMKHLCLHNSRKHTARHHSRRNVLRSEGEGLTLIHKQLPRSLLQISHCSPSQHISFQPGRKGKQYVCFLSSETMAQTPVVKKIKVLNNQQRRQKARERRMQYLVV